MKKRYILTLLLAVMVIISACSASDHASENNDKDKDETETNESYFPVTIELADEEVTIQEKPENIIPLSLELAEIVLELVDPSRIAATTNGLDDPYLSTHADLADKIEGRVGALSNIDPEEIISFDTDLLLLINKYAEQEDAKNTLSQLNTPILPFDSITKFEHFIDAIPLVGEAVGELDQANKLAEELVDAVESIQASIPEGEKPTVLVLSELGGDSGPFMMGPTNISYDLIELAGAIPAVDAIDLERSTPASIEQVLKMDPDYMILVNFHGNGEDDFADFMSEPGWSTLQAVENNNMTVIDAKNIINPNVENIDGLEAIVNFIYKND